MIKRLAELFEDPKFAEEVREKLPYLFRLVELELSRLEKQAWRLKL